MICLEAVFEFHFEFFGRKWGQQERMCSSRGSRSLFFQSGKEFGNVLCTCLIIG